MYYSYTGMYLKYHDDLRMQQTRTFDHRSHDVYNHVVNMNDMYRRIRRECLAVAYIPCKHTCVVNMSCGLCFNDDDLPIHVIGLA
jgi:hypothetical protein